MRLAGRGRALLVPLLAALLLPAALAACDSDSQPAPEPSPTATAAPTGEATSPAVTPTATPLASPSPAPEPSLTPEPPFEGSREPVTAPGPAGALLVQVRYGSHADYDRVVFQFEDALPGYSIESVGPPVVGEFSGLPVDVDGGAFLRVNFGAAAHDENGDSTYLGPRELKPRFASLLEAEETGDFEASLTWVLGLRQAADFRVYALEEPFRVVIDVGHPS